MGGYAAPSLSKKSLWEVVRGAAAPLTEIVSTG